MTRREPDRPILMIRFHLDDDDDDDDLDDEDDLGEDDDESDEDDEDDEGDDEEPETWQVSDSAKGWLLLDFGN